VGEDSITLHVGTEPDGTSTVTDADTGDHAALGDPVASCACRSDKRALAWLWLPWLVTCLQLRRRRPVIITAPQENAPPAHARARIFSPARFYGLLNGRVAPRALPAGKWPRREAGSGLEESA
jgi:hypothetical protein